MDGLMKKIEKHPRSHVARAYRLGVSHSNGLVPLAKLFIRYSLLKQRFYPSQKEANEIDRLRKRILELTK